MRDGWKATLHTASGEKEVECLKYTDGICYLKAEIPEQSIILEIEDDDDYEDGRILCAKKVEEKAEDGSVITRYTWGKWYVDFIGWYQNGAYYINDEMYMSKVYLEDVKLYGAPLVHFSSDNITVMGTLYLDVNYCPIILDFRKLGLSEEHAIGKIDLFESNNTISDFMAEQLNSIDDVNDEEVINTPAFQESKEQIAVESTDGSVSENNYLPVVIGGAVVIAAIFYIRKRKQKVL